MVLDFGNLITSGDKENIFKNNIYNNHFLTHTKRLISYAVCVHGYQKFLYKLVPL